MKWRLEFNNPISNCNTRQFKNDKLFADIVWKFQYCSFLNTFINRQSITKFRDLKSDFLRGHAYYNMVWVYIICFLSQKLANVPNRSPDCFIRFRWGFIRIASRTTFLLRINESDSGNETVAPRCPGVRLGHLFSRCQPLHLLSARCPWLVRGDRWLRMTPSATIEDECLERCLTSIHLPQKTNT